MQPCCDGMACNEGVGCTEATGTCTAGAPLTSECVLQQRHGISTSLASSVNASRTAPQTPIRTATQTRTVRETKHTSECVLRRVFPAHDGLLPFTLAGMAFVGAAAALSSHFVRPFLGDFLFTSGRASSSDLRLQLPVDSSPNCNSVAVPSPCRCGCTCCHKLPPAPQSWCVMNSWCRWRRIQASACLRSACLLQTSAGGVLLKRSLRESGTCCCMLLIKCLCCKKPRALPPPAQQRPRPFRWHSPASEPRFVHYNNDAASRPAWPAQ